MHPSSCGSLERTQTKYKYANCTLIIKYQSRIEYRILTFRLLSVQNLAHTYFDGYRVVVIELTNFA